MSLGVVGKKIGMTRVFTEAGESVPVTVVVVLVVVVVVLVVVVLCVVVGAGSQQEVTRSHTLNVGEAAIPSSKLSVNSQPVPL